MDDLTNEWRQIKERSAALLQGLQQSSERTRQMQTAINRLPAAQNNPDEISNLLPPLPPCFYEVLRRLSSRQARLEAISIRLDRKATY